MGKFKITLDDFNTKAIRRIEGRRYHVIDLSDLVDACGADEAQEMGGNFNVELQEVDLDTLPVEQINSALQSCGYVLRDGQIVAEHNGELVGPTEQTDEILVECCADYGCAAPLYSNLGNNRRELYNEARAESYRLSKDSEAYETAMSRPVNAIGSTAREYGQGDLDSALVRGIQQGNQNAKIMACQVNLCQTPSDDPLAYMAGYMDAVAGRGKPCETKELAPAYLEGYRIGVAVKTGTAPKPEWIK